MTKQGNVPDEAHEYQRSTNRFGDGELRKCSLRCAARCRLAEMSTPKIVGICIHSIFTPEDVIGRVDNIVVVEISGKGANEQQIVEEQFFTPVRRAARSIVANAKSIDRYTRRSG